MEGLKSIRSYGCILHCLEKVLNSFKASVSKIIALTYDLPTTKGAAVFHVWHYGVKSLWRRCRLTLLCSLCSSYMKVYQIVTSNEWLQQVESTTKRPWPMFIWLTGLVFQLVAFNMLPFHQLSPAHICSWWILSWGMSWLQKAKSTEEEDHSESLMMKNSLMCLSFKLSS